MEKEFNPLADMLKKIDEMESGQIQEVLAMARKNRKSAIEQFNARGIYLAPTPKDTDGHIHYWLPVEDEWKCNCGEVKV